MELANTVVNSSLSNDKVDSSPGDLPLPNDHSGQSTSETGNACFIVDLNKNMPQLNSSSSGPSSISNLTLPSSDPNCRPLSDGSFVNSVVIHLDKSSGNRGHSLMDIDSSDDSNNQTEERALRSNSSTQSTDSASSQPETLGSDSSSTCMSSSTKSLSGACDSDNIISDKESGAFQPIILDVRGACTESIFDSPNVDEFNCDETGAKPAEDFPKSASATLRGLLISSGLSQASSARTELGMPHSDQSNPKTVPNLPKKAVSSGTGHLRDINFRTKSVSIVQTHAATNSSLVNSTTQKTKGNNLNLSNYCVVLQNDTKTNQLAAILVPKDNKQKALASAEHSTASSTETLQLPSSGEPIFSKKNPLVSSIKPSLPPAERVANLIDRTVQNMTIKGKDLKMFDLFRVPFLKKTKNDTEFECKVCGESFKEQSGLDGHLVRTVYNLVYDCSLCYKAFVFTNKCQLSLHSRTHLTSTFLYSNIVSFMPYDVDNINPPLLPDSISLDISTQVKQVDSTTSILSQSDIFTKPIQKMICGIVDKDRSKNAIFKCSICNICLSQPSLLQKDLKRIFRPSCSTCLMYLPSACALEAHKKVHKLSASIICPECGETNLTEGSTIVHDKKEVFDHLDRCQHFNRVAELPCKCGEMCTDYQQLAQHFLDKHTVQLFRCQLCALASTVRKQLIAHHSTVHKVRNQTAKLYSSVLCNYCHVILKKGSELRLHVSNHLKLAQKGAKFKWKCFLCPKIYESKEELQLHSSSEHPHRPKRCTNCFTLFANRQNLVDHIMQKKCTWPPSYYQQCADLELSPLFKDIEFNKYFRLEIVNIPKTVAVSSSPTPQASTKFIRIAPKRMLNNMSSIKHVSSNENQTDCASNQPVTVIVCDQNDHCSEMLGEASKTNEQNGTKNFHVIKQNAKSSGKNLNSPVIVNKKLTFQNTTAEEPNKSVAMYIQPTSKNSETNTDVISLMNLSQSSFKSDLNLFPCHQCKIVLIGKSRYDYHMQKHIEKGEITGLKDETECVVCKKQVSNSTLTEHLKSHQQEGVIVCCRCQRTDFNSVESAVSHGNFFCGYAIMTGVEVSLKTSAFKSGAKSTVERIQACSAFKSAAKSTVERIQPCSVKENSAGNQKGAATVFPCLRCGLAFQNLEARDEHVSRLHDGTKIIYHCLKCQKKDLRKTFSKKESVQRHLVKKHRIVKMASVEKFIKAEERNASNGQTLPEVNSFNSDSSPSLPPKRLRIADDGEYMCGKCGFSCSSSPEFSKHIETHNSNKEPQCPECGLCFIIVSALKKHLFAVHKIKNVEDFLGKKDINLPVFEEEEDPMDTEIFPLPPTPKMECLSPMAEKRAVNPLECTVCYKVFDSEINLKTHMRNHGMAFIRSKRHKT